MRAWILFAAAAAYAGTQLGKPLTLAETTSVAAVLANPAKHVGKTVQVKGRVTEVCQMAGCWAALVDPETNGVLRVKVTDGDIVFGKDTVGKAAIAEGKLMKYTLTREQAVERARHEAEEQRRKFDPKSIKSGAVVYQLQGSGAVILD